MLKSIRKVTYLILLAGLVCGACVNNWIKEESDKDITAFYFTKTRNPSFVHNPSLTSQVYAGAIKGTNITVFMPGFVSDRTSLKAEFLTTAETVKVNNTVQTSGLTANNFSANSVVTYSAVAEDGSVKDYSVRVVNPPDREIARFRMLKTVNTCLTENAEGAIDADKNEIRIYLKEIDADCRRLAPSFEVSHGAYLKVNGTTLQSGVTFVDFQNEEFQPHTLVDADGERSDWKVYLKTINSEAEVKDFCLPYENGDYKQVFEGIVSYPDIQVYLNDNVNLTSVSKLPVTSPIVEISEGASYEVEKTFVEQAGSASLYKIKVTSSNGQAHKYYNVKFSYKKPRIWSFKLQPEPIPGKVNNIEKEIPGYIYEATDSEGNLAGLNSIYLRFPAGKKIQGSYIPSFSFSSYKVIPLSHGENVLEDNLNVINRQSPTALIPSLKYRLFSGDRTKPDYIDYEIKADNEKPKLGGANTLVVENTENYGAYSVLSIRPAMYYNCKDIPELNNASRCGDASNDEIIAYDNLSDYSRLKCGLFYSRENNINTLEEIKANGSLLGDYYSFSAPDWSNAVDENMEYVTPSDKCQFKVRQISRGNIYFNMIIQDRAGHEIALADKATKLTLNDYAPPQVNNAELSIAPIDMNGKTELLWVAAYDEDNNPRYAVYYSDHDNIQTKDKAEANGQLVVDYQAFNRDANGLCSYELSARDYPGCAIRGCYFNVMVQDDSGNKNAYKNVKFIPEHFDGAVETEAEFTLSALVADSSVDGYFTYMDMERAAQKYSDGSDEDVLAFPLGARVFQAGESTQGAWSGEHTFLALNVFPNGDVSIDNYSGRFKRNLFPLRSSQRTDGFSKIRQGFFKLKVPGFPTPIENAVLVVGDKFNRYLKLRMVNARRKTNCDYMECVSDSAGIMTHGFAEPARDKFHYLENGQLLRLSDESIFVSHTVQKEKNNRSWRRHAFKIYNTYKQVWKEIAVNDFQEVQNYSLNADFDSSNQEDPKVFYGTEIHPIPPTSRVFHKKTEPESPNGIATVYAEGSFSFSERSKNDGSLYYIPRHYHKLMLKLFSTTGELIKTEKLTTGVIANQYPSITQLDNGDLMIAYAVSRFEENDDGWFNVKTDLEVAIYDPEKKEFEVKNRVIKHIVKPFARYSNITDRINSIINPVTQGNLADLLPGGVSSASRGDKVVIAYRDPGDGNKGKFIVVNNRGDKISSEVTFSEEPVANDLYYIGDPLYSFETFSNLRGEEYAISKYREAAGQKTSFARIILGAFKNNKLLISFVPDRRDKVYDPHRTAKVVIVK